MKTGRNAPCPCGSGKKYKKCCLANSVTPKEALHYRRLSKVLDGLMPKLIDCGLSVFGDTCVHLATDEFFGFPEPAALPGEAEVDRAEVLFWPWFVFNWEYERLEEEDLPPDLPEGRTVAECYVEKEALDPHSLEGQLVFAANRTPYSFWEVLSLRPRQSVRVRDLLTGAETEVQETQGSDMLRAGDLLFGRVIRVGGVSMFLGVCDFVLPPRVKPRLLALRQFLSRGGRRPEAEELVAWAMEIRDVFWELDRYLHRKPEVRNTDGDPMSFHRLVYEIDEADLAVEKLSPLCGPMTVEAIREDAERNPDGTVRRASFPWTRRGESDRGGMADTVLAEIEIDEGRMTVTVNSDRRAEEARAEISHRLGDAARFLLEDVSDLGFAQPEGGGAPRGEAPSTDHPDARRVVGQFLQDHWARWLDEKIPALGHRTPRQAVRSATGREAVEALLRDAENLAVEDPVRSDIELEMIADVRRRLRLDRPAGAGPRGRDPSQLAIRVADIHARITAFGDARLHDTYTRFALDLCDAAAASDFLPLHRGRTDIWAAAIVYAIAQLNFLFDAHTPNHLTPDELCEAFGVKKTTVGRKAAVIRNALELFHDDGRFCAPHITRLFTFEETEEGVLIPGYGNPFGEDSLLPPIALRPSPSQGSPDPPAAEGPPEKKRRRSPGGRRDDRQLQLFDD